MSGKSEKETRDLHLGVLLQPDVMVWRYFDFPRFMALLESQSLYFCRADLFQDKCEGSFTRAAIDYREKIWRESMPNIPGEHFATFMDVHRFRNKEQRKSFYINCWHMNDHESAAMWELYGSRNQSIAVQSSYRTLRQLLPIKQLPSGQPDEGHVDIGIVQYLDYETDPMPQIYSFDPFLRKRKSYAHEKEVRLFYQAPTQAGSYEKQPNGNGYVFKPADGIVIENPPGKEFKVDLNRLIHKIYISPDSPSWFHDLIESLFERYGVTKKVVSSNLASSPIY